MFMKDTLSYFRLYKYNAFCEFELSDLLYSHFHLMFCRLTYFNTVIMAKRPAEGDGNTSGQPPIKKVQFEPIRIGPISTLEEMDMKVLQFQNKKLAQVSRSLFHFKMFLICMWNSYYIYLLS
jgi:hypothetical protein